ncbi:MAG: glycosyltransferase family 2 protein [Chloroflexota bacterium]
MTLPTVSVIVVNYNGRQHLSPCFSSLLALDYPTDRLELILVDNASTDGSLDHMRQHFSGVRLIANARNWGLCRANNIGAAAAGGEVLAILNNDTRVEPDWLKEIVRPFEDPAVACVGSRILSWDGARLDFAGGAMNFYGYGYHLDFGAPADAVPGQDGPVLAPCGGVMAVRRDAYLEAGGEDEDFFVYYEDIDLGWRLWVLGHRVVMAPRAVGYHRHSAFYRAVPEARTRLLYERNALLAVIKNYDQANLRRVLPAALFLMLKRAYLFSGVDAANYHIEPSPAAAPAAKTPAHYLRAGWQMIRRQGPGALLHNVRAEARRRRADPTYDRWLRPRRARAHGGAEIVPQQTVSPLLAAADVVALLPRAMEKRRAVQAARRRPDADILPLFGRPLDVSYADPDYEATQRELVRLFGLDALFEGEGAA